MEGIIRKLDQFRVTLGKYDYKKEVKSTPTTFGKLRKRLEIDNVPLEIQELKKKINQIMLSTMGISLPESSKNSLNLLLNHLDNPDLQNKSSLFADVLEIYNEAEESDFIKMQAFNQMINMLEIKLGVIKKEEKKFKTVDDIKQELEEETLEENLPVNYTLIKGYLMS